MNPRNLAGQPTLPAKHKSTVAKMAARHKAKIHTPHGLRTCFEARIRRDGKPDLAARFGGIPLVQKNGADLHDHAPGPVPYPRKELIHRLLKQRCELCGQAGTVLVHQVRKLASLGEPGPGQPAWAAKMARMRRKTLMVCPSCHDVIHGHPRPEHGVGHWRATYAERRPRGSEEGRAEKDLPQQAPRRAAHPVPVAHALLGLSWADGAGMTRLPPQPPGSLSHEAASILEPEVPAGGTMFALHGCPRIIRFLADCALPHHVLMTAIGQQDSVPSPVIVAAWARLGVLSPEKVPLWAAHWIVAGYDGEHLVHLAGLHGDDPYDVRDVLPGALQECGVTWPESDVAAATVAFTHLARMHLAGQAGALRVAQKVEEVVLNSGYSEGVMSLPLGQVYSITDEWGAGWGRTDDQLAAAVRAACEEQLAGNTTTP